MSGTYDPLEMRITYVRKIVFLSYRPAQTVHSIVDPEKNSKAVDNWINSIKWAVLLWRIPSNTPT